ncbi:aminoglycoside phosphotransferase family protein [Nesterenkonia massiliensis]|uniref:Aminoglycoside phosphotransferase family protein n=1 Tax=Nesterenkonia massiliensis TaxID=1232429 RepID=A0ABT2HM80_9MICC|nr:aminoglycoside phosphotransferase family protein [Nesterenkonia massiliensis]MCT1605788.1 aminoglycoside phosphotransferase family protein [Nesterenkonia massiliensis]
MSTPSTANATADSAAQTPAIPTEQLRQQRGSPHALPPRWLTIDNTEWQIQRAWPAKNTDALLAVEALAGSEALAGGEVRAGWWDEQRLQLLTYGQDPQLKTLWKWAQRGRVVSHRPAKRAVVHLAEDNSYVKVVKGGKASGILDGIQRAAAFSGPFVTPEVLHHSDSEVILSSVNGVGLHDAAALPETLWDTAWRDVLQAWHEAVTRSESAGIARTRQSIPVHSAADEATVLVSWTSQVSRYIDDADSTARAARRLGAHLEALPAAQLRVCHRDLHDKQLLWSPQRPGLLDVDTACLADPALDLGNLRAHARLRRCQGVWTAQQADVVISHIDQTAEATAVPEETLRTYEQAALLRLGCVYAVRPQYAELAAGLRAAVSTTG